MTFCLGMRVQEGLVAVADTRITSGAEVTTARKITIYQHGRHSMFLMTSGLRSVRDKALTYLEEVIDESDATFDRLYKAANAFAAQVRRVAAEDKQALRESGLHFNLFSLLGGQLENDREHKLYLLYPEGNWVEVGEGTPYSIIGEASYGKPLLDRALKYDASLDLALRMGYLAFDATRTSASDVDFPIDVILYRLDVAEWWQNRMRQSIHELPSGNLDVVFEQFRNAVER